MATPFFDSNGTLKKKNQAREFTPQRIVVDLRRHLVGIQVLKGQGGARSLRYGAGFTFVELLVVLILIGIFFAVSIPQLTGRFEYALLNQEARTAAQFLRYAQYRAIADHRPVLFKMDSEENQYQVVKDEETAERKGWEAIPGEWGRPVKLKSELVLDSSAEGIAYFPDGSSSGGSFSLKYKKGLARLTVKPGLGHVKVDFENEKQERRLFFA